MQKISLSLDILVSQALALRLKFYVALEIRNTEMKYVSDHRYFSN